MKKVLLLLLLCYLPVQSAFAQNFNFNRAYQDYLYTYNQYRQAHNSYVIAKNQYLTYKTLTAQNKALIATKEMLKQRNNVLRTYLLALKLKLSETNLLIHQQTDRLNFKIDNEINWLKTHQNSLSSSSTIDDLLKSSAEFEKRYPKTEILIYQTLGEIIKNKENNLYQKVNKSISAIENKTYEIEAQNNEKALKWERWLLEAKNKSLRSLDKQEQTEEILRTLEPKKRVRKNFYKAQFSIKEGNQYLKEAVFYLKEIIRNIKYE